MSYGLLHIEISAKDVKKKEYIKGSINEVVKAFQEYEKSKSKIKRMKKLLFIFLLIPVIGFSQDTIHINEVHIRKVLVNQKTGMIEKTWKFHRKPVKCGYIVNLKNGWYKIDKKYYEENSLYSASNLRKR